VNTGSNKLNHSTLLINDRTEIQNLQTIGMYSNCVILAYLLVGFGFLVMNLIRESVPYSQF